MNEIVRLPQANLVFSNTQNQTATANETVFSNTIVVNGIRYPERDGMDGHVIITNGAGQLSFSVRNLVLSVNNKAGNVVLNKADIGLPNVDDRSVYSILNNSPMTGITSVENFIQKVQTFNGAGPHNIFNQGKSNNIVIYNARSDIILPLDPENGFTTRIINYGNGTVVINAQSPNVIDAFGQLLKLTNYLDKANLLFINNIWNLI